MKALRETIAILLLGAWFVPMQSHAQTPGVEISGPVAAEGHNTAQPVEGASANYHYCARLNAAPSDDVVITATPNPSIVDIDPITFTPGNWSEKQCFNVTPAASADNDIDEPDRLVTISHTVTSSDSNYGNSLNVGQHGVKLRDDDKTLVYVKPANPGPPGPITEGSSDETFEFVVSLGRPLVAGESAVAILGVGPWVLGALGEGLKTEDYTMALKSCQGCRLQDADQPYSFVIFSGAGAQSATLEITANDDVLSEGTEKISVGSGLQWQYDSLSGPTNVGGGVGPAEPFKVLSTNILDTDGDTPNVRIFPSRRLTVVGEGKPAVLTLKLSQPLNQSAVFTVKTFSGEADPGVDYESGPWKVTIPAGATSKSFTIRTISDSEYEGSQEWGPDLARESFRVWLPLADLPTGVSAAIPYDHRIHIEDDDDPDIRKPWCVSVELYKTVERNIRTSQKNGMRQEVAEWTAVRDAFDEQGTFSAAQAREKEKNSSAWKPVADALECMETPVPDSVLSLSAGSAVYEGENAEFTLTADPAPVADLTVNVTVAQSGDYLDAPGAGSRTVTLAAGATTATLALATIDDDTDEPEGSVSVTLGSGTGYTAADGQESGSITVSDDDPWSVISVAGGSAITEGSTARFTLTATPAPQGTLTVNVNIAVGGAFVSSDAAGLREVTIGTTGTATFDVPTDDDDTDEPDGAIGVAIFPGRRYTPSETHGAISIAVSDDDGSTTKVKVAKKDAAPAACVSADLRADVDSHVQETWRAHPHVERWNRVLAAFGVANGHSSMTATEAQTYADRGLPRWVPVVTALECLEGAPPPPALPAIRIADGTGITEGGDAVFTVSASPAPAASLTVSLTLTDDGSSDFLAPADEGTQTVTIAGGQSSATLTLTTENDSTDEADGSVSATVADGTGYIVGTPATGTVAVSDNDPTPSTTPVISIAGGAGVTEGGDAVFTVSASPAPAASLTVSLTLTDDGASDFLAPADEGAQTVTIAGGQSSATLTLTTEDDSTDEADGSVSATVADGTGYTVGTPATGTVAVSDDDPAPSPVVGIAGGSAITEGGTANFTLTATPAPLGTLTVKVNVVDSGAFAASGETGARTVTLDTTGSATLAVATDNDSTDEPDGTLGATIASGQGYTPSGTHGSASIAVSDDDAATTCVSGTLLADVQGYAGETWRTSPGHVERWNRVLAAFGVSNGHSSMTTTEAQTYADRGLPRWVPVVTALECLAGAPPPPALPAISIADGTGITEGGDAVFTVSASPAPTSSLTVSLTVADDGTSNFLAQSDEGTQTVTIAGGQSSATLTLTTEDDSTDEADGSVSATVAGGTGYTVGSPSTGTVAVSDNDPTPSTTPVISIADGTGITEGGDAAFTVSASPAPAANLTVSLTVADDGSSDFLAPADEGTRTVTIAGGQSSATLTLTTEDDSTDEADGSVSATVAGGTGYTVGSPSTGTVAVSDNDPTPSTTPVISIADGTGITEGGDAVFTVSASPAPTASLTVSLTVADDGTSDFLAPSDEGTQTVTIAGGQSSATLTLTTENDSTDEADGSVSATVAGGTGYTVGSPSTGTVAVSDNDPTPSATPVISIAAGGDVSEGAAAEFTLTASPVPTASITVDVALTQGGDFASSGQTGTRAVTIASSGTATVTVATDDDSTDEPDGSVTATVQTGTGYSVAAAPGNAATVAVADNDGTTSGPTLSIADASFTENERYGYFTVTLSEAMDVDVRFAYATRDSTPVSATANADYAPVSRAWKIGRRVKAGQTQIRFWIPIRNDSHDEGPETFEVEIFDAFVWRAGKVPVAISDAVAVGTITNSDPMPAAWLARFGRMVAEQALDGIAGRIADSRSAGVQGSFAGQALSLDSGSGSGAAIDHADAGSLAGDDLLAQPGVARAIGTGSGPAFGLDAPLVGKDRFGGGGVQSRSMTGREVLLGSNFTATGETDATGGSLAFWGRAAQSSFDGREGTFSLDGESTAAMLGADYARDNWLLGVALLQTSGKGGYADRKSGPQNCPDAGEGQDADMLAHLCTGAVREGDGKVEASLTAAVPYASLQVSERMKLWGALGHGTGEVVLKPKVGGSLSTDISWTMAAGGLRGDVIAPPAAGSGAALAVTSDALWARTSSDRTRVLAASDSDVTRLRLGLEGSWRSALADGGHVTPKLEAGMRHDGGDAETGFGVEVGGGLAWEDPTLGLTLDLSGRTLITHDADDLKDRGFAASLIFDPEPASDRGLSLGLRQDWGGQADGGLDSLFRTDPLADRTGSSDTASRWAAEAAYGFPVFSGRFTGSPHGGLGLTSGARDYSVGWRLAPVANANAPDISFGVLATRRESDWTEPEHTAGLEAIVRW